MAMLEVPMCGKEIAQALGIDTNRCVGIEIKCDGNRLVTVKVELIPHKDQMEEFIRVIKHYKLVKDDSRKDERIAL